MKRRIIFGLLWVVAFALFDLLAGMLALGLLGLAGMATWSKATVLIIGRCMSLFFFAMPALGLALSLLGVLPGTRQQQPPKQA